MSQDSGGSEVVSEAPGQQGDIGASRCGEVPQTPENKGDSPPSRSHENRAAVPPDASGNPGGGQRSGKQNDKQNDKRASADPDLAQVIDAWPDLPQAVRAGIVATVKATRQGGGK